MKALIDISALAIHAKMSSHHRGLLRADGPCARGLVDAVAEQPGAEAQQFAGAGFGEQRAPGSLPAFGIFRLRDKAFDVQDQLAFGRGLQRIEHKRSVAACRSASSSNSNRCSGSLRDSRSVVCRARLMRYFRSGCAKQSAGLRQSACLKNNCLSPDRLSISQHG
jgi:hypothetical protein